MIRAASIRPYLAAWRWLFGLVLLPILMLFGLLGLSAAAGRTPAGLLGHLDKMPAEASPALGDVVAPALRAGQQWFAANAAADVPMPCTVPVLPPNPAWAGHVAVAAPRASPGGGRVPSVGPGRAIRTVAAAVARDGDTVEIDPGDDIADVALWRQSDITIRGMGPRVRMIAAGASAEQKAIWVLRGGKVTIEGIDFIGARVPDRNGAGIPFETGHLVVRRCLFVDNPSGILASPNAGSVLEVEESEFGYHGAGDGLSHHIHANQIRLLKVTGSHLHHADQGHLIKSRAARSVIAYNRLSDESGGRASYELEFPNGGESDVIGNIVQQGSQTANSVMVSYGAEGYRWPMNRLRLSHNTLVNDHPHGGTFVRAAPDAELVLLLDNLLVGRGSLDLPADAVVHRNRRADRSAFAQPSQMDYRLMPDTRMSLGSLPAAEIDHDLLPRHEYKHPAGMKPLDAANRFPGAMQSAAP